MSEPATILPIAAPCRRGKTLARRTYQKGNVFQRGRKRSDAWLPKEPAYVQFWEDVPGRETRRRKHLAIGIYSSRTRAERAAAEKLEQLGINSAQTFIEATSNVTFQRQAEIWLKSLANRKRNPLEQTTINTRRYALDKWMYPFFDGVLLADLNNRAMKEFVEHISGLSAATVRDYANIVKGVVASAIDDDGEQLFPRTWNDEYIDAPLIDHQKQPSTDKEGMERILREATGQYCRLYALLAGCGPLRVGEAMGLEIGKHISKDYRTLYIRQKAKRGLIQPYLKTQNGVRDIDLCTSLATMLNEFIGNRTSGLLFCTSTGRQLLQANTLQDSLHPILKKIEHEKGGSNIFRRFRITQLETAECPKALQHFWSGHAPIHVSERYKKLLKQRDWRLERAEKVGTGFELPMPSVGLRGLLVQFPKAG